MRHVAVLAAAVVMLTAIAVPAQGKGGEKPKGGSGGIDAYCIDWFVAVCPGVVFAYDTAKTYRVLQMVLYDSDGIVIESVEDRGTGYLYVESGMFFPDIHVVTVYLYKVDKELNPSKLIDRVVCTYEDEPCISW